MSSKRKIWSLPLVLVTALLLVGLVAASVLAQTAGIVTGGGDVVQQANVTDGTTITTIAVEEAADGPPAVAGVEDDEAIVAVMITGADARLFEVAGADNDTGVIPSITVGNGFDGIVSPRAAYDHDEDTETAELDPSAIINDVEGDSVFTFDVVVWFDSDTAVDSGNGYRDPEDADDSATDDNPDAADGTGTDDQADDRDTSQTVTVTVYVPKVDPGDDVAFATIPGSASEDDLVYDDADNASAKGVAILGLPSSATVSAVTDTNATSDSTVFYGMEDAQNVIWVKYQSVAGDATAEPPVAANDYANALATELAAGEVTVEFEVHIDSDTDADGDDADEGDDGTDSDDNNPATGNKANDRDFVVLLEVTIKLYGVMSLEDPAGDADAHSFAVRSAASSGTQVGVIDIAGADRDETIDIISDSNNFDVAPRRVGGADMQAVITVASGADLASLIGNSETFTITANAAFLPTRTDSVDVTVRVTASNEAPVIVDPNYDSTDEVLPIDFAETDSDAANLIEADEEIYDFGSSVSDSDSLTFSRSGDDAALFAIDSSTGVVTLVGDLAASMLVEADEDAEDIDSTSHVDESMDYYTREDGVFSNGENMTNVANDDVSFEFTVSANDRANTVSIPVELTVNVNEPVSVSSDTAAGDYVSTDPFGGLVVDVAALIDGGDEMGDAIDFDMEVSDIAPFDINDDGEIRITFPGRVYAVDQTWTATIAITDGFDNSEEVLNDDDPPTSQDPRQFVDDATITVTITAVEGDPPDREHIEVTIMENAADGSDVVDLATHADLAGKFAGATSYEVVGGDGEAKFDVSTAGMVTVKAGADLDVDAMGADDSYLLSVSVTGANNVNLGEISVVIDVMGVNEMPVFATASSARGIDENAQTGSEVGTPIMASDPDGDDITFSISASPFAIVTSENADGSGFSGQIMVDGVIDIANSPYEVTVKATDDGSPSLYAEQTVTITLGDINDAPTFDTPVTLHMTIAENADPGTLVATYNATDEDAAADDIIQGVKYVLRNADDTANFAIEDVTDQATKQISGRLTVAEGAKLEYDITQDSPAPVQYTVEVNVCDAQEACNEIALIVTLENMNDETPVIGNDDDTQDVPENSARGTSLGEYGATDKDNLNDPGFDEITYTLGGDHGKYFQISISGELMTLASLDYDRVNADGSRGVPCVSCDVIVIATDSDDPGKKDEQRVTVSVSPVEDSVSTLRVTKANPVPGTAKGNPMSALSNTKTTASAAVPERPAGLPAIYGDAPMNFVATEWANWGTVLRIEVTAESPGPRNDGVANASDPHECGNGNQCVVIEVNSDSADDSLRLAAYRSAEQENKFVAALMLVELSADATEGDGAVYMHGGGGVPALRVDEEDEIEIEFGNLRGSVDVENEAPEISNFAPEHEAAFDDADVDYTFTVTDSNSGLPEPEDLPDIDGDDDYTPVVALISRAQCVSYDNDTPPDAKSGLNVAAQIDEDETLYCPGANQGGEFIATGTGWGFAPIRDDKDFDEIDDGFDVETTIVLDDNRVYYVTFIVCDNAGNCSFYDPDGNDDEEELAQITVDTEDPVFVEARTGLTWDSTDNEYDDNRSFIQLIFNDLTTLNVATVEIDDFVVEGHTIKDVHVFENPDKDDVDWDDSGRYAAAGDKNLRKIDRYRDIENAVFVELEDDLLADETPDVTIVPNGVEDSAGNEQDDGDHEADDWISPKFTIVSIVSTLETAQDEILAGDGDEVTVTVTADERLDSTRPTVVVTYVKAPAGSVDTKGTAACKIDADTNGTRDRGEIVSNGDCQNSSGAKGGNLNNSVEKVSNTEWIVTITEPKATGYYSFRIEGNDRSPQENPGSEGISADSIVTDFFDSDGDVNVDDAVFFEGDINLAKPNVRVSGMMITDNEPTVEYRSPLFVELDFTGAHSSDCGTNKTEDDYRMANCENENSEYAEDNFDDIVVTMFELDGVDMTDSVRTTDDQTFLVTLESISLGDHTAKIQAMDVAGNVLEDILEIDFEVSDRDPFSKRLSPGWNLVSLPGQPADSSIASVFGPGVEVRTVYTYDPVVPGGWQVAVRETLDSDWQGDLTEITGMRGYWVLSDAIQDWEVSIPRLAGGAAGTGTPIQPPVIPLYAGWNLIPVTDVKGNALDAGVHVDAETYLQEPGRWYSGS